MIKTIERKIFKARLNNYKVEALIVNPTWERNLFLEGHLKKSESLEAVFKLPIIVSNDVTSFCLAISQ